MKSAPPPVFWPMDGLTRVFPRDDPPRDAARRCRAGWMLDAALGEVVTAHFAARTDGRIARIALRPGPLRNGRAELPPSVIRVRHTELVPLPLAKYSPAERPELIPGWYPDPLFDENPWASRSIRYLPPTSVMCHLALTVPRDAVPGDYRGTVEVLDGTTVIGRIPLRLTVWPFHLPRHPTFHVTNWFHPHCLALWHRCEPWSERFWRLLERVAEDMAAHRQDVIVTPALFGNFHDAVPLTLVDVTRTRAGRFRFDFERLGRWVRLFDRHGFAAFELWHFLRAGFGRAALPFEYFDEARGRRILEPGMPVDSARFRGLVSDFFPAFLAWCETRGIADRFLLHVFDEPKPEAWPHYARVARWYKSLAPRLRLLDAISSSDLLTRHGAPVDIPVPLSPHLDNDQGYLRRLREGKPVWWYTCCAPVDEVHANRFVSQPLAATRILPWQAFGLGLQGFLHWGYNAWHRPEPAPPAGVPRPKVIYAGNPYREHPLEWAFGDAAVVYPHPRWWEDQGPVNSLRHEAEREGLQDLERFRLLEQSLAEAPRRRQAAVRTARRLLTRIRRLARPTDWCRNSRILLAARRQAGACLAILAPSVK